MKKINITYTKQEIANHFKITHSAVCQWFSKNKKRTKTSQEYIPDLVNIFKVPLEYFKNPSSYEVVFIKPPKKDKK